jgi:putative transcriptional regulator
MPISKSQHAKLIQLGAKVKSIRNNKKLTLKELAYSIGKDPQSIHRLETGDVNPSYLYLLEVCKGLEIEITELLNIP